MKSGDAGACARIISARICATYLADNVFAEIRAPLLTVGFTDDPIATRRTVAALNRFYPNAARESRWYTPADAGGEAHRTRRILRLATSRHPVAPVIRLDRRASSGSPHERPRAAAAADHITPYDRLALDEGTLIALLASRTPNEGLVEYFGAELHAELATLARATTRKRRRAAPQRRVYVLPGIMGSQLGFIRGGKRPNDILWLDPIDIAFGRLTELTPDAAHRASWRSAR